MIAKRCIVYGRVQGVWFRASTQREAAALGVAGHARNLPDGSVEVLAQGDDHAVARLCEWLWQGPELASVDRVVCEDAALTRQPGFNTA